MKDIKSSKIGIIGAGALGGSLAIALNSLGYQVPVIFSRSINSANYLSSKLNSSKSAISYQEVSDKCDVIFITTPDKNIKEISDLILWKSDQIILHCSGVSDLDVLNNPKKKGASVGSMHPLYPFSDMNLGSKNLKNVTFGIDGDDKAILYIKKILTDLESIPIEINSDFRALYHLSGVMAGNLLLGLGSAISDIWEKIGLDRSIGSKSLIPMMINSCENILKLGIPNSMAGPYVRGDVQTIKMHLEALKKNHSELLPLYIELAKTSIKYSNEKVGLEQTQAEEVLKLLELYS